MTESSDCALQSAEWKPILGYDCYLVNNYGEVWSKNKDRLLRVNYSKRDGYGRVTLKDGIVYLIHRLVASAFFGDITGRDINHKDGDKTNNSITNLEIVTQSENAIHCAYNISKLTKAASIPDKDVVIELHNNGESYSEIANQFGVSKTTVKKIINPTSYDTKRKIRFEVLKDEYVKLIPGYTCYYASNFGRIMSTKSGKEVLPQIQPNGYAKVNLFENGVRTRHYIHRLVALTFIGKSDMPVNHIDRNRTNNRLDNLEYLTQSENVKLSAKRKLTEQDKNNIKKLKSEGYSRNELSRMFNITVGYVSRICRE